MKAHFKQGAQKEYRHVVTEDDLAKFNTGIVHQVYSTFALTRDAEWSGRLFVLDMLDEGEEGIGTFISTEHESPAFLGEEVLFISTFQQLENNEVHTSYECRVGHRLIAHGIQRQKIVNKEKLDASFEKIKSTS